LFTFYYDAPPFERAVPTTIEKTRKPGFEKFIYSLKSYLRFQIRLGKLSRIDSQCSNCSVWVTKYKQKRVDNLLTVDLTRAIWTGNINKAILITGDSDFVPAVEQANRAQILTHVYYLRMGNTNIHDELYNSPTKALI
jgi:uncharacterized LabA/DUF88 family protein